MRDFHFPHFLTFVLTILTSLMVGFKTFAAPQDNPPPRILKEPLQNVEDPLLTERALETRTDLPHLAGVSFAWLGGQVTKKLNSGSQTGFGFSYSQRDGADEMWDAQAHWLSSETAWLQVGKKFILDYDGEYEPYYRLGVSHFVDPDDALAGFFRFESFKASASVGFLDLFSYGRLITTEAGLHWGLGGLAFHLQAGLQMNF